MHEQDLRQLVDRFNAAWNAHDLDAALALCCDDVVFDSTGPAPDGMVAKGLEEVRSAWAPIFGDERARFEVEQAFVAGDRLVQQWRYDWVDGHVRGVDIIVVRDGKVSEKLCYVKG